MKSEQIVKIIPNRETVNELINRADNQDRTRELIEYFERKRKYNQNFFLTYKELNDILKWKLRDQYDRQERNLNLNTNEIIKEVTSLTFKIHHDDIKYQDRLRIQSLMILKGIGVKVASAVLTIVMPESYCVIDKKIKKLFFPDYSTVTLTIYQDYLNSVRDIANKYDTTPQKLDMALWQYCNENQD